MLSTHRIGKGGARCTRSFSLARPPKACRATTLHTYVIKRRSGMQSRRLPDCSSTTERDLLSALEGEVKILENTFARIMSDQLHFGIEILSSREVRNREFTRLPMSCPLTNDDPRSTNAVEIVKSSVAGLSDINARALHRVCRAFQMMVCSMAFSLEDVHIVLSLRCRRCGMHHG